VKNSAINVIIPVIFIHANNGWKIIESCFEDVKYYSKKCG